MDEPEYNQYTTEELVDILNHIDKDRFPERTERVEVILSERKSSGEDLDSDDEESTNRLSGWDHYQLFMASFGMIGASIYVLFFGLEFNRFSIEFSITLWWERVLVSLAFLLIGCWALRDYKNEN